MKHFLFLSIVMLTAALTTSAAQAQWVQTNGPYVGWIYCVTPIGNNIFIGTQNGLFKSTDSGSHWMPQNNGLPNTYIYAITACGTSLFAGTYLHGVYRSTDNGASWSSASDGLPKSYSMTTLGSDGHSLFIPNDFNSYRSSDNGNSWILLDTNLTKFSNPVAIVSTDSTTYLAGSWITSTTDGGVTWDVISVAQGSTSWDILAIAAIGQTLFVADPFMGVMRSTDHGTTWNSSTPEINPTITCLTSVGTELFAGNEAGVVYRSADSGTTWKSSTSGLPIGVEINSLASKDNVLFAGLYGLGIFRSYDSGNTWAGCSQGFGGLGVNVIANAGDSILSGTTVGLFLSTDNGMTWQSRRNGMQDYDIESILVDGVHLFVGTDGGENYPCLFMSTDRGVDWSAETIINGYNFAALIRNGSNLIAGGEPFSFGGFYTSSDNGEVWKDCTVNLNYSVVAVNGIVEIGSTLLASTNAGPGISADGGITWGEFDAGLGYQRVQTSAIGATESEVFTDCLPYESAGNFGIFVWQDDGANWQHALDTIFPSRGDVTCFASFGDSMFAATDSLGIFLTTDNGAHWLNENLGLSDTNILSLAIQGDELLAGTATSGVWRRPLAEMIASLGVASEKQTQDAISVYPDPASGIVNISCPGLTGTIKASLISETGATVWQKTILKDGSPFQIDLTGVSNGAYRLELQSGTVSQSSKIILQR